jgi:hypothetical protein
MIFEAWVRYSADHEQKSEHGMGTIGSIRCKYLAHPPACNQPKRQLRRDGDPKE